ncbi:MAG: hypothetical protein U0T79_12890 [Ferruginibacter sp.]
MKTCLNSPAFAMALLRLMQWLTVWYMRHSSEQNRKNRLAFTRNPGKW